MLGQIDSGEPTHGLSHLEIAARAIVGLGGSPLVAGSLMAGMIDMLSSCFSWCRLQDLNLRPPDYKSGSPLSRSRVQVGAETTRRPLFAGQRPRVGQDQLGELEAAMHRAGDQATLTLSVPLRRASRA